MTVRSLDPTMATAYLDMMPLCMVVLNSENFQPIATNDLFERKMGPLYKFENSDFCLAASDDKHSDAQARLRKAILEATNSPDSHRVRVRNVEMLTVTDENQGFPIRKFFDWFIRRSPDGTVLVMGDPCTDQDVTQREKDGELIDFFQNAPIALHWLSGEGKVIWANQTELNVLGYSAEEYIGQDIMKFCPDEEELVLEIFKQLGSGNAIKDVPVRFRTKDGKIVHLLIDSNVRYEKDGSFGHTRCFIRDDTGRKIRETHASLLLDETRRSLTMLDNFMARSLQHLRTPLIMTRGVVDAIDTYFKTHAVVDDNETLNCKEVVRMANSQIENSVAFLDDVADLAKFEQGGVLQLNPQVVQLETLGKECLRDIPPASDNVQVMLDLRQHDLSHEGPAIAWADPIILRRILLHLLNNAVDVTNKGMIALGIGYKNNRLTIRVSDTGPGLEMPEGSAEGDLPVVFQKYHQEFVPESTNDLTVASSIREKIEACVNSHKKTGIGIGLSLTYHLVQALGGELRCYTNMGKGTKFEFSLPQGATQNAIIAQEIGLSQAQINYTLNAGSLFHVKQKTVYTSEGDTYTMCSSEMEDSKTAGDTVSTLTGAELQDYQEYEEADAEMTLHHRGTKRTRYDVPLVFDMPEDLLPKVPAESLAALGVKSQDPPSILVVEDTNACARMLCRILSQFKCATKWAENGKVALECLKEATNGTYDLVLMDLRMPVMDGFEATRIIKSEYGSLIPVVAITGDDNEETREKAIHAGFDDYYAKPVSRHDLKNIIKELTGYQVM